MIERKELKLDNQHKLIKGYRDLTEQEIALMNEAKALAEQVGSFVEKCERGFYVMSPVTPEDQEIKPDARWVSIGKTHLQQGFMAVIRSIAKPETF